MAALVSPSSRPPPNTRYSRISISSSQWISATVREIPRSSSCSIDVGLARLFASTTCGRGITACSCTELVPPSPCDCIMRPHADHGHIAGTQVGAYNPLLRRNSRNHVRSARQSDHHLCGHGGDPHAHHVAL